LRALALMAFLARVSSLRAAGLKAAGVLGMVAPTSLHRLIASIGASHRPSFGPKPTARRSCETILTGRLKFEK
jgi:hypothetical protein